MTAVLVTGGAGYIGSHVCKALAEAGRQPICFDTLEKGHDWAVRWGPLERGDIGDAVRLDDVLQPPSPDRGDPSRGLHRGGRIGEPARALSAQQRRQVRCPDRSRAAPRRRSPGVFQHLRRLRPAANRSAGGDPSHRADQPLCRVQGARRARVGRRGGPRAAFGGAALFQCRRRRCRRRDRRGAPSRDPSAAARRRRRSRPRPRPHPAGHRLSDARRLVHPRLRACDRPRGRPSAGARAVATRTRTRCSRSLQPRQRHRLQRAPGDRRDRADRRPRRAAHGGPPAAGRFAQAGRRHCQGQARARLDSPTRDLAVQIEDTLRWRRKMPR